MSACKSCGAPVVWAMTREGKRMPLDAKPEVRVIAEKQSTGELTEARVVSTYTSHFATCPNAAQHRKAKP